jgi:hypothetical protein
VALYLARALLAPLAALVIPGCVATTELYLKYCEDESGQVTSCDCSLAPREVLGGRVGRVNVHEYQQTPRGVHERRYRAGGDLQFVLRGRWLVIELDSLGGPATSLLAWLRCDGYILAAETIHRDTVLAEWDHYKHQFLALFPPADDPDDLATPRCQLNLALVGPYGAGLMRYSESVYVVNRTSHYPAPIEGETWNVSIREDPAPSPASVRANLDPPPPPPEPRLCRGAAVTTSATPTPASPPRPKAPAHDPFDPSTANGRPAAP